MLGAREHDEALTMIAVTCSACHLRFEAPAVERRLKGPQITCPACDAGEPIVLDFGRQADEAAAAARKARRKVTPPPLDLSGAIHVLATQPAGSKSKAPQPPSTLAADEAPSPVYVDFDDPPPPPVSPAARTTGFGVAFTGIALAAIALVAPADTLDGDLPLVGEARRLVAGIVSPSSVAGIEIAATEAELTTGTVAPITAKPPLPRIARVATELAETDAGRVLTVRTDLRNPGDAAIGAPALRIAIRDDDGTILHRWTATLDGVIEPGETRAFTATTTRIPEGAGDVKVDFAER